MPSRLNSALDKARSLTCGEWWALAQVSCVLPATWVCLRVLSLPQLLRLLSPGGITGRPEKSPQPLTDAQRAAWLVQIAARFGLWPSTCLSRSVTLWWLLRLRGVPAEIRLGVQTAGTEFTAHAWVEVAGQPVNDANAPEERYAAFSGELMPRQ